MHGFLQLAVLRRLFFTLILLFVIGVGIWPATSYAGFSKAHARIVTTVVNRDVANTSIILHRNMSVNPPGLRITPYSFAQNGSELVPGLQPTPSYDEQLFEIFDQAFNSKASALSFASVGHD